MNGHPSTLLPLPRRLRSKTADIDVRMVPLIEELWRKGWRTLSCCQGTLPADLTASELSNSKSPDGAGVHKAYIGFGSALEAALFAALAGPTKWQYKTRWRQRNKTSGDWMTWWDLEHTVVRFPSADIEPAIAATRKMHHLKTLIGEHLLPDTSLPIIYPGTTLESDRIGALSSYSEALQSAPVKTCPQCQGAVLSRRKDARYCSRVCQLAARKRKK